MPVTITSWIANEHANYPVQEGQKGENKQKFWTIEGAKG